MRSFTRERKQSGGGTERQSERWIHSFLLTSHLYRWGIRACQTGGADGLTAAQSRRVQGPRIPLFVPFELSPNGNTAPQESKKRCQLRRPPNFSQEQKERLEDHEFTVARFPVHSNNSTALVHTYELAVICSLFNFTILFEYFSLSLKIWGSLWSTGVSTQTLFVLKMKCLKAARPTNSNICFTSKVSLIIPLAERQQLKRRRNAACKGRFEEYEPSGIPFFSSFWRRDEGELQFDRGLSSVLVLQLANHWQAGVLL